jgi:hypothetical protein
MIASWSLCRKTQEPILVVLALIAKPASLSLMDIAKVVR